MKQQQFTAVVMGSSAGGIKALSTVLESLPRNFPLPIVIVQHLHPNSNGYLVHILGAKCTLMVKQAEEKEHIKSGIVYLAPPNYHLLIEEDRTFSLSLEERVNFSRPSIDVLFESAVYAYRHQLIGVILTGANSDGSLGLKKIKQVGGYAIVQDPDTAEADAMPRSAILATPVDKILPLDKISTHLLQLVKESSV
ncbi:MAG: chemotaxis protein CheB [Beggiatoa sp. IS2]|nr:MAG: chemotaxis protein CheB [Beggiatoa sp. IS2]